MRTTFYHQLVPLLNLGRLNLKIKVLSKATPPPPMHPSNYTIVHHNSVPLSTNQSWVQSCKNIIFFPSYLSLGCQVFPTFSGNRG